MLYHEIGTYPSRDPPPRKCGTGARLHSHKRVGASVRDVLSARQTGARTAEGIHRHPGTSPRCANPSLIRTAPSLRETALTWGLDEVSTDGNLHRHPLLSQRQRLLLPLQLQAEQCVAGERPWACWAAGAVIKDIVCQ